MHTRNERDSIIEGVTALEVYELTTQGGGSDFATMIAVCQALGDYCLIGGLAVNCFVEPVYTLDADMVIVADRVPELARLLRERGFEVEVYAHSLNARAGSNLRVQFTTDERYQEFLSRSVEREVLGMRVNVACLEDVTRGKLWAWGDPQRRFSKRKKDELDLIRLAEAYPELKAWYPESLRAQITDE